jgi:hypothetical protein
MRCACRKNGAVGRRRWRWLHSVLVMACLHAVAGFGQTPEKRPETLPQLSLQPERALCDAPLEVRVVNAPANAQIRFTTDGTEPTLAHGADYQAPWTLTRTTILRVAAFVEGNAISRPSTHTYLFLESTLHQPPNPKGYPSGPNAWQGEPSVYEMDSRVVTDPRYHPQMKAALRALPSLSLVCPPEELFGAKRGLYLHSRSRGVEWEKASSLEWLETNGAGAFQVDCGLRIQGNTGRRADKTPKHSFRVLFKGQYGASKLRHRVFPDSAVGWFDTLVLRADYNNAWTHWNPQDNQRAQRVRDAWLKDSHRAMGWLAGHCRYVHLYLNGLYWGIYDVAERPDASFAAAYLGGEREDYDVLDDSGVKAGSANSFRELLGFSRRGGPVTLERAGESIDVTQFIDYLLLNFYAGNMDWGEGQNWYAIRRQQGDRRFRYYVWDGEMILQSLGDDVVNRPPRSPFQLGRRLALDPEYRLAFADRVQKHCFGQGALTPAATASCWRQRVNELKVAILAESARWGSCRRNPPYTRDDWYTEQRRLLNKYFPQRTQVLLNQLRTAGLYPDVEAPNVTSVPLAQEPGQLTTLTVDEHQGSVLYYTTNGIDPRVHRTNQPADNALIYQRPFKINAPFIIKTRARRGTNWSALVEDGMATP